MRVRGPNNVGTAVQTDPTIEILVRLSTAKTANAERRLAVCRLPFRPRCSSV